MSTKCWRVLKIILINGCHSVRVRYPRLPCQLLTRICDIIQQQPRIIKSGFLYGIWWNIVTIIIEYHRLLSLLWNIMDRHMDCGPSWISQSIRQRRIRENAFVHSDPQTNKKTTSTPFPYAQGDLQAESPHINRIQPNPRYFQVSICRFVSSSEFGSSGSVSRSSISASSSSLP